jgi:hypothetical protein
LAASALTKQPMRPIRFHAVSLFVVMVANKKVAEASGHFSDEEELDGGSHPA